MCGGFFRGSLRRLKSEWVRERERPIKIDVSGDYNQQWRLTGKQSMKFDDGDVNWSNNEIRTLQKWISNWREYDVTVWFVRSFVKQSSRNKPSRTMMINVPSREISSKLVDKWFAAKTNTKIKRRRHIVISQADLREEAMRNGFHYWHWNYSIVLRTYDRCVFFSCSNAKCNTAEDADDAGCYQAYKVYGVIHIAIFFFAELKPHLPKYKTKYKKFSLKRY